MEVVTMSPENFQSAAGQSVWNSIINSPNDGSGDNVTRFGRAMTLPDTVNNLGKAYGSICGEKHTHSAYVSKGEGGCMLESVISRLFEHDGPRRKFGRSS